MSESVLPVDLRRRPSAEPEPSAGVPRGSKVLLLLPPFYTPYTPPLGISVLKAYIDRQGYRASCFDFNTVSEVWVAHHRYFEVLQRLEGLTPQHGYTNLWYILQAHMMTRLHGVGPAACARMLARVLTVYDLKPDPAVINALVPIVDGLFLELDRILTRDLDLSSFAVVGTSTYSTSLGPSLYMLERVKELYPHILTVMGGGVFADDLATGSANLDTLLSDFPYVDHIIMGEGEVLFRELLTNDAPPRLLTRELLPKPSLDMKEVLIPDYSDFRMSNYLHLCIEGARSCPFQCHFCSETVQWGGYRKKPAAMLADQMLTLAETHGNRTFFMGDSLMNPYIEDLSKALLERGGQVLYDGYLRADKIATDPRRVERWARSGCVRTRLGIESGSAKILKAMRKETTPENISRVIKTLSSAGIRVTTLWIVGFPGETDEDFEDTLNFIRQHHRHIYELDVHYYYYYPYGQVWSRLHESYPLYPPDVMEAVKFQQWEIVDCDPPRHVKFARLRRINQLATELGIPNLHSLQARYQAEERWQRSFPLAAEFFEGALTRRAPYDARWTAAPLPHPSPGGADDAPPAALVHAAHVQKRLDDGLLRRAAEALAAHNECLHLTIDADGVTVTPPETLRLDPDMVRIVERHADVTPDWTAIAAEIAAGLRSTAGHSCRIHVLNGEASASLLIGVHAWVADGPSVVMLLEDFFRIYEQLAHDRPITLAARGTAYMDYLRARATALDVHAPAAGVDQDDDVVMDRQTRQTRRLTISHDIVRKLTPAVPGTGRLSLTDMLAAALVRGLLGDGGGGVAYRHDLRSSNPELAQTCGPLHMSYSVPVARRSRSALDDARQIAARLASAAPARPESVPRVAIDFEALTAEPWLGGGDWTPGGFLGGARASRAPIEVRATREAEQITLHFDFALAAAAAVERLGTAGAGDLDHILDSLFQEVEEEAGAAVRATKVRKWPLDWH